MYELGNCLFEAKSLSKNFGGVSALDRVDLSVTEGLIMGLIGPNGAGKTTFFNVISGILPETSGDFYFRKKRLTGLRPYQITRMGIARTFQNIKLFSGMNVIENVIVGRHIRTKAGLFRGIFGGRKVKREMIDTYEKVEDILSFVGLKDKIDFHAGSLPYGEQRHIEIARALATEPDLLLLDEPSAGMNTKETESLMELIRDIRNSGTTVLLIEHDMNLVMDTCEIISVLDHGKMIAYGTPKEIRNNEEVIEAYLGREEDYEDLG